MPSTVYFDNTATTLPLPEVLQRFQELSLTTYGNSSASHLPGRQAQEVLEEVQLAFAQHFGVPPQHIIFTSGGTESNNQAIWGSLGGLQEALHWIQSGSHSQLLTSTIEHQSVSQVFECLENLGLPVSWLPVNQEGLFDLNRLESMLLKPTRLVSLHHVQNVVGVCQDLHSVSQILRRKQPDALFHVDAVQSWLKVPVDMKKWGIDLLTVSAHKNNGPKGLGLLVLGERFEDHLDRMGSLLLGASQQHGLRPGTVPIPTIGSFLPALLSGVENFDKNQEHLLNLRQAIIECLPQNVVLNGPKDLSRTNALRSPQILNFSVPGLPSPVAIEALSARGVFVSAGSACNSTNPKPNQILLNMGAGIDRALSSIRISVGPQNTFDEVLRFGKTLKEVMELFGSQS